MGIFLGSTIQGVAPVEDHFNNDAEGTIVAEQQHWRSFAQPIMKT
eukprot:CAMPEP_0179418112 /NCGR_PEP_ID=MMETSP0799-20121207/7773_1 /TAXON_ID=46947 /ORGANISM="Geminigera cryophila, Strain CCMP2564" /LENGTH=44 /DNA_ID= /DNA_START= /DNA_END= /DNA_ORIENTATION=